MRQDFFTPYPGARVPFLMDAAALLTRITSTSADIQIVEADGNNFLYNPLGCD